MVTHGCMWMSDERFPLESTLKFFPRTLMISLSSENLAPNLCADEERSREAISLFNCFIDSSRSCSMVVYLSVLPPYRSTISLARLGHSTSCFWPLNTAAAKAKHVASLHFLQFDLSSNWKISIVLFNWDMQYTSLSSSDYSQKRGQVFLFWLEENIICLHFAQQGRMTNFKKLGSFGAVSPGGHERFGN